MALPFPSIPALLNAQSSLPYTSTARPTIASTSARFETSARANVAAPPAAATCLVVSWPPASVTSATTTLASSHAKISAAARPIPDPPPVTSATFPATRPGTLPPFRLVCATFDMREIQELFRQPSTLIRSTSMAVPTNTTSTASAP